MKKLLYVSLLILYLTFSTTSQLCRQGEINFNQKGCVQIYYIEGCIQYDSNAQCTLCQYGYTNQNGQCAFTSFDTRTCCANYTNDGSCSQCSGGMLVYGQNCYSNTILGCIQRQGNVCSNCAVGFVLNSGKCNPSIPNCNSYSQAGQCQSCLTGVLKNGYCVEPVIGGPTGCISRGANGCLQCDNAYYLASNRQCVLKQLGCLQYSGNNCVLCSRYYQLVNGKCVIFGCKSYDALGCTECQTGYTKQGYICHINGCTRVANNICIRCKQQLRLSSNGCVREVASKCSACGNGMILNNGQCVPFIPKCTQYSQQVCTRCDTGYVVVNGICQIIGCQQTQNDVCISCVNQWVLRNGFCFLPNCVTPSQNGCVLCQQGYQLIGGLCYISDPTCLKYQVINNMYVCRQCKNPKFIVNQNGQCVKGSVGCLYNVNGVCQCAEGFIATSQGSCVLPGCSSYDLDDNCLNCNSPYTYDSVRKTCNILGCNSYSLNGCVQCRAPFVPSNGICVIPYCQQYFKDGCAGCETGYLLKNNECIVQDPNCLRSGASGCLQCVSGYSLINKICTIPIGNCQNYGFDGVCIKCGLQYVLNQNKQCIPRVPGCSYQGGQCKFCTPPFEMNQVKNTCEIVGCVLASQQGCLQCLLPFVLGQDRKCSIANCNNMNGLTCGSCMPGYHLYNGYCVVDDINCKYYNRGTGLCEKCTTGMIVGNSGSCIVPVGQSCVVSCNQKCDDNSICLQCAQGFFLNRFKRCQKTFNSCTDRTNGICSRCDAGYYLYSGICFPYRKGCVRYEGKDCVQCRVDYKLRNGQCFNLTDPGMKLLGTNDKYDFDINPIDIRQSKYYIDNLSPASAIGTYFFSSFFDDSYKSPLITDKDGVVGTGWRARFNYTQQYIGITISESPVTFYAIQLQAVGLQYITSFYIEYSVDGTNYIRVAKLYQVPSTITNGLVTIYFNGIYAQAIRIVINSFVGWPAARVQFFYYDLLRMKKISNLRSLKYLTNTINSNFVDRVQNQLNINLAYFFNVEQTCKNKEVCYTGLELCQNKNIQSVGFTLAEPRSLQQFYITFSQDGRKYNCYNNCNPFSITGSGSNFRLNFHNLYAQGIRVYPVKYNKSARFIPTFYYK